jgi:tetratricopeptide (TPR) repeat protein
LEATAPSVPAMPGEAIPVGPWALTLLLLLAAAVYVDSLGYQFVWDDLTMVVQNPNLLDLRNLPRLLRDDFTTLTSGAMEGHYFRPVMALSLALDATLWGPNPAPFHFTNILLHVAVTFLVSCLVLAMGATRDVAVLAALIFAIHPVHVEAVAFVSARSDLLPTIAALGCLLAYRRAGVPGRYRMPWSLVSLLALVLALLSKESTVILPPLLVLSDLLGSPSSHPHPDRGTWRRALARSLPFWGLTAMFMAFRYATLLHVGGDRLQGGSLWRRLPGSLEILARYVWLSLVPTHMQPFYSLRWPESFLDLGPALGLLAGASLVILLVWCWRRAPMAAFGVAWFLISVIPVLDLVPLSFREMGLTDRYLYLPSVGVSVLFALGITRLMGSAAAGAWRPRRVAGWGAVLLILTLYPWSLLRYAPVWRNNFTLYARMERDAPRSPNPPLSLGLAYFRANDLPRATAALERAVRLNPGLQRPRAILALLYVLQGRAPEGLRIFDAVAAEGPSERDYYVARTMAHLFVGESNEALTVAEEGALRFPGHADLTEWLGRALERAGRPTEAMDKYRQALALRPDLFQVEEALGNLLARSGRAAEAVQHFLRSAEIRPDRAQPIRALALLLEAQGNTQDSLRLWRQVLELAPNGAAIREATRHIRRLEERGAEPGGSPPDPRKSQEKAS